ncbi:MAG: hypothetical protein LBU35_00405 [Holosporales bacterium]|jgi:hypothetical protein|nr:hypothetical protein [Holosporales bacterium]
MLSKLLIFIFFVFCFDIVKGVSSTNAASNAVDKLGAVFDSISNIADKLIDKTSKSREKLQESKGKFQDSKERVKNKRSYEQNEIPQAFDNYDNAKLSSRNFNNSLKNNANSNARIPKLQRSQKKINNKTKASIKRSNFTVSPKALPPKPNVPYNYSVGKKPLPRRKYK